MATQGIAASRSGDVDGGLHAPAATNVELRPFPYPYRCAVAICSDLDGTPNGREYDQLLRFLNTDRKTEFGPGVGLECANSIYFDMPPGQFSYWNASSAERAMIQGYIQSGHVDVLHSYGDVATIRGAAVRALDELERHRCRLSVWVDHSKAPTNFGADIMHGHGDDPTSPAYHADLTVAHGVRFVWRGRVTSVIGQDAPHSLGGLFTAAHPLASTKTIAKELFKHDLADAGNTKYAMHGRNALLRPITLRDGANATEFLRFNPHWRGVAQADDAGSFAESLSPPVLDRLSARGGCSILYTHFGKFFQTGRDISPAAAALRRLAQRFRAGEVFVTTTNRLLGYVAARGSLRFDAYRTAQGAIVQLRPGSNPEKRAEIEKLQGMTFALPGRHEVEILSADGRALRNVTVHAGNVTYAMIPWKPLVLPEGNS